MLGLNMNVDIDVKHAIFPVYFKNKNICIHCGSNKSLIFVNAFGKKVHNNSVDTFSHLKCTNCGRTYSILWEPDDEGTMKPSAVEYNVGKEFMNFIKPNKYKDIDSSFSQ